MKKLNIRRRVRCFK